MSRRQLRAWLPALALYCNVMPWHIDPDPPYLTAGEFDVFSDFIPSEDDD